MGHGASGTIVSAIDIELSAGESIGIVGESGSGKSMTARALTGLLPPGVVASGNATYRGTNLLESSEREWRGIRGREIGLVMQDPFTMLNPVMRCGRILEESILPSTRRQSRAELRAEAIRRFAEVGITDESVVDRYPFQLSGGMRQRVAIAAALARDPQVLIADEPSTALDVVTQREVLALIKRVQQARGMGLILITHDLRVAFATCDRIQVLYAGSLLEDGRASEMQDEPLHPYTQGLLLSEPPNERRVRQLLAIPGSVPSAGEVGDECPFAPRCGWAESACRESMPELRSVAIGHQSRCVRLPDIREQMRIQRSRMDKTIRSTAASTGDALIEMINVEKVFQSGNRIIKAVDGVSMTVRSDESVAIVGESGSGKTTVARMLVGLEEPSSGEIVIDGTSIRKWNALSRRDRRKLRKTVQIVFQDPYSSLNPMHTIGGTLGEAIVTHHGSVKNLEGQVTDLLTSVGLPSGYAQRRPVALSGGERQRVAIARALAADPRVLICDESVSALDMSVQAQILNLLNQLRTDRGIGSLFITHDLSIVRHISQSLYVMHRGSVVESGPTESVLDHPEDPYTRALLAAVPRSDGNWLGTATVDQGVQAVQMEEPT